LLVDAARSSTLAPNEMIAVDGLLKRWAAKVIISRIPPEDAPAVLRCTDLAGTRGLWAPASKPSEDGTVIFFDLKELSDSLRRRIRKLAAGVPWNELSLPQVFANVAVTSLLTHIFSAWCEGAPREVLVQPSKEECEVATGSLEVLY